MRPIELRCDGSHAPPLLRRQTHRDLEARGRIAVIIFCKLSALIRIGGAIRVAPQPVRWRIFPGWRKRPGPDGFLRRHQRLIGPSFDIAAAGPRPFRVIIRCRRRRSIRIHQLRNRGRNRRRGLPLAGQEPAMNGCKLRFFHRCLHSFPVAADHSNRFTPTE